MKLTDEQLHGYATCKAVTPEIGKVMAAELLAARARIRELEVAAAKELDIKLDIIGANYQHEQTIARLSADNAALREWKEKAREVTRQQAVFVEKQQELAEALFGNAKTHYEQLNAMNHANTYAASVRVDCRRDFSESMNMIGAGMDKLRDLIGGRDGD